MTTSVGQEAVYRLGSSRYVEAIVTHIVSGDTVDLVAFCDGAAWGDGDGTNIAAKLYTSIAQGTGVGEWQPGSTIANVVTPAIAAIDYSGLCAAPGAASAAGLSLGGAGVQLSTTRPALLVVRGTASMTSTLAGGQGYTVELRCDSASTPTTIVDEASGSLTQTLGVTVTLVDVDAWKLVCLVPAGYYVRVVHSAGAATVALTGSAKQVL